MAPNHPASTRRTPLISILSTCSTQLVRSKQHFLRPHRYAFFIWEARPARSPGHGRYSFPHRVIRLLRFLQRSQALRARPSIFHALLSSKYESARRARSLILFEALPLMSLSATHSPGNLSPLSCEPSSSPRSVIAFFAKVVFCWPTARTEVATTRASIWQVCGRASQMSKPCATPKSGAGHDEEISSSSLSIRRNPLTRPSSTVFFASFLFPPALCAAKTYRSGRLGRGP